VATACSSPPPARSDFLLVKENKLEAEAWHIPPRSRGLNCLEEHFAAIASRDANSRASRMAPGRPVELHRRRSPLSNITKVSWVGNVAVMCA